MAFISAAFWNNGVRPGGGHIAPEAPERKTEVGNGGKLTVVLAVKGFGYFDIQMANFLLPAIFHRHVEISQSNPQSLIWPNILLSPHQNQNPKSSYQFHFWEETTTAKKFSLVEGEGTLSFFILYFLFQHPDHKMHFI